uniref:Uncharacterized protein n=1 Tax=Zea mays TaxID=4577 RepID=C4J010_MAIZE|nr:unknown [Zea mays]
MVFLAPMSLMSMLRNWPSSAEVVIRFHGCLAVISRSSFMLSGSRGYTLVSRMYWYRSSLLSRLLWPTSEWRVFCSPLPLPLACCSCAGAALAASVAVVAIACSAVQCS